VPVGVLVELPKQAQADARLVTVTSDIPKRNVLFFTSAPQSVLESLG